MNFLILFFIITLVLSSTLTFIVGSASALTDYVFRSYVIGQGSNKPIEADKVGPIAVDLFGNIYMLDYDNYRIQKFSNGGDLIWQRGEYGLDNGDFDFKGKNANGVAISRGDIDVSLDGKKVFVADTFNNRIQKFDNNGVWQLTYGPKDDDAGDAGTDLVEFDRPMGIAVANDGNSIFVADTYNHRIQRLNADNSRNENLVVWGGRGEAKSMFSYPTRMDVDSKGDVYVIDSLHKAVDKFTSDGIFIKSRTFNNRPVDITYDSGNLLIGFSDYILHMSDDFKIRYTIEEGLCCGTILFSVDPIQHVLYVSHVYGGRILGYAPIIR